MVTITVDQTGTEIGITRLRERTRYRYITGGYYRVYKPTPASIKRVDSLLASNWLSPDYPNPFGWLYLNRNAIKIHTKPKR